MSHPYRSLPDRSFWRSAVADLHPHDMRDLWHPPRLTRRDRVATAGSCFAQHLGRNLRQRGAAFLDLEPAPPVFASEAEARRFGYGVFSCRTGNIYTTRQLHQLAQEALGLRPMSERVWEKQGRYFDALRPGLDPVGEESAEEVRLARRLHLAAVRQMLETVDLFVFTLGLTEAWEALDDGTCLPAAPGTIAGAFDPARTVFRNFRYEEVLADLQGFHALLRRVNPSARMLLTVSPVPLIATASGDHVLPATIGAKSVLRAVAGAMAEDHDDISYFPSYEIITGPQARGFFYERDLRSVNEMGVALVMRQFFTGPLAEEFPPPEAEGDRFDPLCDESKILQTL